mmetsp:Transcript_27464/g.46613  ORF Transcript_27464/g.46613 Transcript_27464/m.46613 type:complete len:279 (-) Transcript_27464:170-1006(-)
MLPRHNFEVFVVRLCLDCEELPHLFTEVGQLDILLPLPHQPTGEIHFAFLRLLIGLFKPLPVFEFRLLQRQDGLLVIFNLFLEVAIFSLCVVNSFQSLFVAGSDTVLLLLRPLQLVLQHPKLLIQIPCLCQSVLQSGLFLLEGLYCGLQEGFAALQISVLSFILLDLVRHLCQRFRQLRLRIPQYFVFVLRDLQPATVCFCNTRHVTQCPMQRGTLLNLFVQLLLQCLTFFREARFSLFLSLHVHILCIHLLFNLLEALQFLLQAPNPAVISHKQRVQ